ncbi:hypothetical protein [Marinomonas transparens]|uniref:Uncharacterized protein n=1 Tax=Marinomonas transparens TaxID=2795388 RepID=A0A934JRV5_9GAMM|nr:hypothetical protein [Marinomonas transparens]MBJ7536270.1 hypothetical protein [Marinomonas transparens]
MTEHSIEFLGQKFSYPSTWQGAFSILVVCASATILAVTLSPEQIESIGVAFGTESDKQFNDELIIIQEKLSQENAVLKAEISRLTQVANIPVSEKQAIALKIEASEKAIGDAYSKAIETQMERQETISTVVPSSNLQQRVISFEKAQLEQQIGWLQQQQQQQ